jgi:hypothetical protein
MGKTGGHAVFLSLQRKCAETAWCGLTLVAGSSDFCHAKDICILGASGKYSLQKNLRASRRHPIVGAQVHWSDEAFPYRGYTRHLAYGVLGCAPLMLMHSRTAAPQAR